MQHFLDAIDICVGSAHATLTETLGTRKLISALLASINSLHSGYFFMLYLWFKDLYG